MSVYDQALKRLGLAQEVEEVGPDAESASASLQDVLGNQEIANRMEDGGAYTVVAGDTLGDLAKRATGDASRYRELNEYNQRPPQSSALEVGEVLLIPPGWDVGALGPSPDQTPAQAPQEDAAQARPQEPGPAPTPDASIAPGEPQAAQPDGAITQTFQSGAEYATWLKEQAQQYAQHLDPHDALWSEAEAMWGRWHGGGSASGEVASPNLSSQAPQVSMPTAEEATPLGQALGKVGEVSYVDPHHGQGAGKRDFTRAETRSLTGGGDIDVASCSPFMYWTLAVAGHDINAPIPDTEHLSRDGEPLSIREILNMEERLFKEGETMGQLARAGALTVDEGLESDAPDADRIKGAALAFELAGIGAEVTPEQALPGDYVQTYSEAVKSKEWSGGHSTMVHRAHCEGAAIFGLPDSPIPKDASPTERTPLGFDGEPVAFIVDEKTNPSLLGEYVTKQVELVGAHLAGTDSDGKEQGGGVYTKAPKSLDEYHSAYIGRLSSSPWAVWTPAQAEDQEEAAEPVKAPQGPEPTCFDKALDWWNQP